MTGPTDASHADVPRPPAARWWPALVLIAGAVAMRWPEFGRLDLPGSAYDELLYLVIGDHMLHGGWPVLDLWDRKPPGLFAIYAVARAFGGAVLPYQLLATASAAAGAILVWRLALRGAGGFAGVAAGLAYLAWLRPFAGEGGQSPVFYDTLIAAAALLAARAGDGGDPRRLARLGLGVAALGGLAAQVKYTAAIEAAAIGAAILWRLHAGGAGGRRVAGTAAAMALLGALPTVAVAAFYAWHGGLAAFWYADALSALDRAPMPAATVRANALFMAAMLVTPAAVAAFGLVAAPTRDRSLLLAWIGGATLSTVAIGNFYIHYALPLVAPLTVAAAPFLRRGAAGLVVAAAMIVGPLHLSGYPARPPAGAVAALTAAIRPHLGPGRCLFVYDGSPLLYLTTRSCLPSRIVSPDHFANAVEAPALGLDIARETARVLAARPAAIVTGSAFIVPLVNRRTYALVADALARDYVRAATVRDANRTYYVDVPRTPGTALPPARMMAPLPRTTGLALP